MIIKKIKFHNFRNFYGDQEIEFAYDGNKNVTVILGENTYGKTTIISSFIWCFYGESRLDKKDDILNKKIQRTMIPNQQESVSVEVDFIDNDIKYNLKRTSLYSFISGNKVTLQDTKAVLSYINESGNTTSLRTDTEINEIMYTILPKDLSDFFFFEGEKNNNLTRKDLKDAVNTLLGYAPFKNMMRHLYGTTDVMAEKSVISQLTDKCSEECGTDTQNLQDEIKKLAGDLQIVNDRLKEITIDKNKANSRINEIDLELKKYQEARLLGEQRIKLESLLAKDIEKLEDLNKLIIKSFNNDSLGFIMNSTFEKVNKRLSKSNLHLDENALSGIDGTCIKELLKRGQCLCGLSLKPGTEHYKTVEQYINILPPQSLGILIKNLINDIDIIKSNEQDFINDFEEIYNNILKQRLLIDESYRKIADIRNKIMAIGNADVENLESERTTLINDLKEYEEEFNDKTKTQTEFTNLINTKQQELDLELNKNEKAKKYKRYLDYAYAIYNWLKNEYQRKEDEIRSDLEIKIKYLFDEMFTGHREVSIDDEYNVVIKHEGSLLGETGGLRIIKYFAYVAGVVALANEKKLERAKDKDNILVNSLGEEYPLVLDAAFSHADTEHTKNISKTLSNSVSQLVFALMSKDWENAQEGLINKVGKIYKLNKIDEDEAKIEVI